MNSEVIVKNIHSSSCSFRKIIVDNVLCTHFQETLSALTYTAMPFSSPNPPPATRPFKSTLETDRLRRLRSQGNTYKTLLCRVSVYESRLYIIQHTSNFDLQ